MSAYGYGPPPPPPSTAASGTSTYGHPSGPYTQHGQGRGGGGGASSNHRGRGGHHHGGRGDYHGSQARYDYTGQPYPSHNPVPYAGSHPPPGSYPHQPSWTPDHGHAPPPHAHPHAPVPISASNYHPNYAPQIYPASQYPQQASYASQSYDHPYQGPSPPQVPPPPPPPSNQPQWNSQGAPHQSVYGGNRRSRGGFSDRGGHNKPAGPPRHGFDHEAAPPPPPPPMMGVYGQPLPHDPRAAHYPLPHYPYAAPPPAPGPPHQAPYYGQYPRRGRGGGQRDGNVRGRGGHNNNHQGGDKTRHQKPPNQSQTPAVKQETPSVGKKKKRKTNTLGLTPGVDSDAEQEDEHEGQEDEKVLAELLGHETPAIDDIAKYLEQRRKNFPTKARIEAKKAAELAQDKEDKAASLEKEADRLRKQLRKVEFSIKRKREQGDEGDEMRDPSDESSDDEKPEVMSSHTQAALPLTPSGKKADVTRHCKYYSTGGTCGKKGKCRFVHDPEVREAALKEREANNGRLTIQQRLILNDKEQEDLAVLQSIQYLRDKGLMLNSAAPTAAKNVQDGKQPASSTLPASLPVPRPPVPNPPTTSTLPAASPSLPPPPIKREPGIPPRRTNPPPSIIPSANSVSAQGLKHYEGWLLQPYGSTSGKRDNLP